MLIIRGRRVVFPDGERPASLYIDNGRIVSVANVDARADGEMVDCGDLVVSPGLVDSHVHVNEPGRTEWEGFETATAAAAAGGVTTIVDMPLNAVPPTMSVSALQAKRSAANGRCHVDVAFWGGVVPGNGEDIEPLIDAGVRGFKCFLVPSGVDEFPPVDGATLDRAMPILARRGVPLLVHAELPQYLRGFRGDASRYADYAATRPVEAEVEAIEMMAARAADTDAPVHIVHVSSASGVDAIAAARARGTRISGETCPHYLTIADEEVPDGATEFKCAPPIRSRRDRDALWNGLETGALGPIVTDHSPAPASMKCPGDFVRAWGGIASLELSLSIVWTSAIARRLSPSHLSAWMSAAPAALAGLGARKGRIAVGADADLVVWDPDARFEVAAVRLQQRHKLTPYAGRTLRGAVQATFVRGVRVWHAGALVERGYGQLL